MINRYLLYKIILVYSILLGCVAPLLGKGSAEVNEQTTGSLKYEFIMMPQKGEPVPITDRFISGEMLKNEIIFYYKPLTNTYVYLYAILPGKKFQLIRPFRFKDFNKFNYFYHPEYIYFSKEHQIQAELGCWELHFIVSTRRLPEIENLLSRLDKITENKKEKLTEFTNKLSKEIRYLQIKKISGSYPVELPEYVNSPFRTTSDLETWLDENAKLENITDIYEQIYLYGCEKEP